MIITGRFTAGRSIDEAANEALTFAKQHNVEVEFNFNGIMLIARTYDYVGEIVDEYRNQIKMKNENTKWTCDYCGKQFDGYNQAHLFRCHSDLLPIKNKKRDYDELMYHLISVLNQTTGYMRDDDIRETKWNSDAFAVFNLITMGYAEYDCTGLKEWPETKKFKFRWTQKAKDLLTKF